jgi:integrase
MARKKKTHRRTHGAGTYYARGNRHIIQWTELDGTRKTKSFPSEELAKQTLAQVTANVIRGEVGLVVTEREPSRPLKAHAEAWLALRTNASAYDDRNRWNLHLASEVGSYSPNQVGVPELKQLIKGLLAKGLSKSTANLCISLLSSLYSDLVEDGVARLNPVKLLSKATREKYLRSEHDPRKVPFIRTPQDVERVYRALLEQHEVIAVAYALGALAGLRTGEVLGLRWSDISFERKEIHVQVQCERTTGRERTDDGFAPLKDGESRVVPLFDSLAPLLLAYRARCGGHGLVCPSISSRQTTPFLNRHVIADALEEVLERLQLDEMTWYQATRHTFASQWVLAGGSLEKLCEMMGHSSVTITERYAHLRPDSFNDVDRGRVQVNLVAPANDVAAPLN